MPTYEYKCPSCQKVENHLHKIAETFEALCSDCFCEMIKGVGGGIGVHFKGSGFYETDYKRK